MMVAAAVTAGMASPAVPVAPTEIFSSAMKALRRVSAASQGEAGRIPAANDPARAAGAKQMEGTRA